MMKLFWVFAWLMVFAAPVVPLVSGVHTPPAILADDGSKTGWGG